MLHLHNAHTYAVQLDRNGPGPTWTRRRLSAAATAALVRELAAPPLNGVLLRNDYAVVTDEVTGYQQHLYF
jgi:hypothetical protein